MSTYFLRNMQYVFIIFWFISIININSILQSIPFFSNFIVYLFIIYLTHWKSITYQETIDCFFCFFCLRPFCENAWMMAFANFWFGGNLWEWFEAKKFFCLWTWPLRILIWWQFARMIWGQKIFLPEWWPLRILIWWQFANFDLVAICENDLVAICENDLRPKNFSACGHGSIYYI